MQPIWPASCIAAIPFPEIRPSIGIKFSSPIVANGKVYISAGYEPVTVSNPRGEIDVYGLK